MTVLAVTPQRTIPWSMLRTALGVLLLLIGVYYLVTAFKHHQTEVVGLGVMFVGLGLAASFEQTAETTLMPSSRPMRWQGRYSAP